MISKRIDVRIHECLSNYRTNVNVKLVLLMLIQSRHGGSKLLKWGAVRTHNAVENLVEKNPMCDS